MAIHYVLVGNNLNYWRTACASSKKINKGLSTLKVPLLDLQAQHAPLRKDILSAIDNVIDHNGYILGPEVAQLEEQISRYCGSQYAIGVSSGTDALLISLMALKIKPGDEIITTPLSFFATAGSISRVGAKPVFADIDPVTYNIDPQKLEKAITPATRAIIPVHLYGQCADMGEILAAAEPYHLHVVEDAAQALGAQYQNGQRAGSLGQLGCFSFFPSKNLGGLGDGGMVVTNDSALQEHIRILRVQGGRPKYHHKYIGGNFRLDTLQAAVLNVKLPYVDQWTRMRQKNATNYKNLFDQSGLLEKVEFGLPSAVYENSGVPHYHIFNQYVIRVPDRDILRTYLKSKSIGTEVYYPVPFHLQDCYQSLGYSKGDFPESERACQEALGIPIYPELTESQQEYVVDCIQSFYKNSL